MKRPPNALFCALFFLLIGPSILGQGVNPETPSNKPVRVTGYPLPALLGGPQTPPYDKMATFISNAFTNIEDGIVFVQDSSVCSIGTEGTSDFEPTLHADYIYDDDEVASVVFSQIQDDGSKSLFSKKQFTIEDQKLIAYMYSRWDDGWIPQLRESMNYDPEGRLISVTVQNYTAGSWENQQQDTYTFLDGNLTEITSATWSAGTWKIQNRVTAAYNINDLVEQVIYLNYTDGGEDTSALENYFYDAAFEFILEGYALWQKDDNTESLTPVRRELYEDDFRGFYSGRLVQFWIDSLDTWRNAFRDDFEYSPLGIWKNWRRQNWQEEWVNRFYREFRKGEDWQVDVMSKWVSEDSIWLDSARQLVQFDSYGNLVRERSGEIKPAGATAWENGPDAVSCRHYWSEKSTSSISLVYTNLIDCILANPYSTGDDINCMSLDIRHEYKARLFDQLGRLVYSQIITPGQSFSIESPMPGGMYYLLVQDREQVLFRRKIAIQN